MTLEMKIWFLFSMGFLIFIVCGALLADQECIWGPCKRDPITLKVTSCDPIFKGRLTPRRMGEIVSFHDKSGVDLYLECKPIKKAERDHDKRGIQ